MLFQDKCDDVFNASDSDTMVPSVSQDSPDNRASVDSSQAIDGDSSQTKGVIFEDFVTFLLDLTHCVCHPDPEAFEH